MEGILRRGLSVLLAAVTGLVLAQSPAEAAVLRVMVVGDSVSHGSAGDYTWRYRLWKHLTGSGVAVDFVGPRSGLFDPVRSPAGDVVETGTYADPAFDRDHNARWGRALASWPGAYAGAVDTIQADVRTYQPDYVLVLLGINDLVWFGADPVGLAGQMAAFIDRARTGKPGVRVVVAGVPPTYGTEHDSALAARFAEYNRWLGAVVWGKATDGGPPVAYVPPPAGYEADYGVTPHDSYDGTHPNARGEIRIADAVGDVLSSAFGLGPPYPLSLTVPVGPVLPFTLRCAPGDGKVTLTWTESPGATGYWYQLRFAGGAWVPDPAVYQYPMSAQPVTSAGLANGTAYEFRMQAAKWYDKGVYSNVCRATPGR
ncbi:GDSL-type esterase/lipase family protein [Paractinoplanes atraurantiacus]|nr:GDSL-type esterase/lipase family protein [Actinoplanes atraurantiacus]